MDACVLQRCRLLADDLVYWFIAWIAGLPSFSSLRGPCAMVCPWHGTRFRLLLGCWFPTIFCFCLLFERLVGGVKIDVGFARRVFQLLSCAQLLTSKDMQTRMEVQRSGHNCSYSNGFDVYSSPQLNAISKLYI